MEELPFPLCVTLRCRKWCENHQNDGVIMPLTSQHSYHPQMQTPLLLPSPAQPIIRVQFMSNSCSIFFFLSFGDDKGKFIHPFIQLKLVGFSERGEMG